LKTIVFTTFGSLGDLHPYIALAVEWNKRGNHAVIATSEVYRKNVESEGIIFAAMRPGMPDTHNRSAVMRQVMDMNGGPEYLIRRMILPSLRNSYEDLSKACCGADGIVGHPLTFTVPMIAHLAKIPWAYVAISPTLLWSAYDPPVLAPAPWLRKLRAFGPGFYGILMQAAKYRISPWFEEVRHLSRDLGIYPVQSDPMGADQYSKTLNLALFSSAFAAPQPDWPVNTVVTGFPFYDQTAGDPKLPDDLEEFLNSGDPPIIFTLGSAAVNDAGRFYVESAAAAQKLGRRAVLLVGRETGNHPAKELPSTIHVTEYAPYSSIFARCAAIVHQGGIGTTAEALRAGKPMLVMPYAFDQPDNGCRAARLGVARTIKRSHYTAATAAKELEQLLGTPRYSHRAEVVGRLIRMENGASTACDSIESRMFQTRQ
jgi:UDP:flavonoid glycosyltransferase YjiC (YdhE family)